MAVKSSRFVVSLGVAVALQAATSADARMRPHAPCDRDTSEVEAAIETTASLSALDKRMDDDLHRLQRLAKGLDQRTGIRRGQDDWMCQVAHGCGRAVDADMTPCLRTALQSRARHLEQLIGDADR